MYHNLFPKECVFIMISPPSFTRPVINIFMTPWVLGTTTHLIKDSGFQRLG